MSTAAKNGLRGLRAPDEPGAERRGWDVVRTAYAEREPLPPVRRSRRRIAVIPVPLAAVLAAGVVLSPAGATVGRLITHALGVRHAAPALSSLPSAGRLLVSGPGGTWTAAADGSIRRLGSWPQASWSPHGLYVTVAAGDRLAALDPNGNLRWSIAHPHVSDPRWYSPSGYRVAYLSAGTLRVIGGHGTGDHLVAARVAPVAPAWRPGQAMGPFELAYVSLGNRLVVRDADSGALVWQAALASRPREVMWSGDGRRLVVLGAHSARVYTASGVLTETIRFSPRQTAGDGALSPDGGMLALVVNRDQAVVVRLDSPQHAAHPLLTGSGVQDVSWSPDARWLVVSWPAANQWVFVRVAGAPRVAAVSRITQQFSSQGTERAFPQLEGWCCTARGPAG
jgi:hypothetical protein